MQKRILLLIVIVLLTLHSLAIAQKATPTSIPIAEPSLVIPAHTGGISRLIWSPDGSILVSSSGDYTAEDYTVRLWHPDGSPIITLMHDELVYGAAWSPDGTILATGTGSGVIHLWDRDGSPLRMFQGERGTVYALAWSPDGQTLASGVLGGTLDNAAQLWTVDGTLIRTLPTRYSGGKFYNVGWSPDGNYIVNGAIDYTLWQSNGTPIFTHEQCQFCTPSWGFTWSPDSTMWAIGNESGVVVVYDITGQEIARLQNNGNTDVLTWSPDGKILAGGSSMWLWDADTKTFTKRGGSFNGRTALAWSPDGETLAASTLETRQMRWVNGDGDLVLFAPYRVDCLAWSPDGQMLVTGGQDGKISFWTIPN